ncbi:hypothetical protein CK934_27435 [Chitinophaga sp. MD30]|nr:hypothetical protein CK934_27435 [Chitinophaga sp. MD30]
MPVLYAAGTGYMDYLAVIFYTTIYQIMKVLTIVCLALGLTIGAQAQIKKASLQAAGLTCAMCSNATLKSLQTLPFISKVDTDLDNTTFLLYFKPGAAVNVDQIQQKVDDAGFSVAKLVLTADFDGLKVEKDSHVPYAGNTLHFVNVKDQELKGETALTVIDKNFVTARQFKKYSAQTKMSCYQTGVMEDCCKPGGKQAAKRILHVTI